MARFLHRFFVALKRNRNVVLLASSFLGGILLGIQMSHFAEISVLLMRGAPGCSVSIVSLLCAQLLPPLFSALAVYYSRPQLLYGIAFLKAFLFAFVAASVSAAFGNAGWLARLLILFSDSLSLPLMWLYWLRHIPGRKPFQCADLIAVAGGISLIGILDHNLIMPLLQGI